MADNVILNKAGVIDSDVYPSPNTDTSDWQVSEPKENQIKNKSFDFALRIVSLYEQLQDNHEYVLSKQVLRSGTSIGANVEEATAAESKADFIHKLSIASKEARETNYWLRLLLHSNLVKNRDIEPLLEESIELIKMLTAIVKTATRNSNR
jgi:four helix bundle protein